MSEHIEGVVPAESFEVTDESIEDFINSGGAEPGYHPILKIWSAVLEPAKAQLDEPITPQWANRITSSYREISFADMLEFRERYFGLVDALRQVVEDEIATDEECLTYTTPEEDVEHNSGHYKNVLRDWQKVILQRELDWDCADPHAGVEIGVISEVHKMFFGPTGLTQYLDNIKFEFTEADSAALAAELEALKEGR